MKIVLGEVYLNRTRLYLTPIVNTYGKTLTARLNQTAILAWGLYDVLYLKAKGKSELKHHLFVLQDPGGKYSANLERYINRTAGAKIYNAWLEYVRSTRYYVDDYVFEPLIKNDHHGHMVMFQIPDRFRGAYDRFLEDKFSEMYNKNNLEDLKIRKKLPTGSESVVWKVLTKQEDYKEEFIEKINRLYGTSVADIIDVQEFDSHSIKPVSETFNDKGK